MHILWFLVILGITGALTMIVMGLSVKTDPNSSNLLIRITIAISVMGTVSLILSCIEGFGPALRAYEAQGLVLQANDPWFKWLATLLLAISWCIMLLVVFVLSMARFFSRPPREFAYAPIADFGERSFWRGFGRELVMHILAYSVVGLAVVYVVPNLGVLWRHITSVRR